MSKQLEDLTVLEVRGWLKSFALDKVGCCALVILVCLKRHFCKQVFGDGFSELQIDGEILAMSENLEDDLRPIGKVYIYIYSPNNGNSVVYR